MISWPKPNQYGYDTNGFRKLIQNILVNKLVMETNNSQAKIDQWNQVLKQGIESFDENIIKGMVREGIPDTLRKQIWPLLIKGDVPDYQTILTQPFNQKASKIIDLDVQRTFPNNIFFSKNQRCSQGLKKVLNALSISFPQIGYCQGLNYIVATTLLRLSEQATFNQVYFILRGLNHGKLLVNMKGIMVDLFVLDRLVQKHFKQFYQHLKTYEVDSYQYATHWFITLFCCGCLPFEYTLRIMELYLNQGKKILFRVALTILKYKKHKAKSLKSFEDTLIYLKNSDDFEQIPASEFMKQMFNFNISMKEIDTLSTIFTNKN